MPRLRRRKRINESSTHNTGIRKRRQQNGLEKELNVSIPSTPRGQSPWGTFVEK